MAGKVITDYIKMQLFKKGGAIASDKAVKFSADALEKRLKAIGIDPNTLNSQTELKQLLAYVKQAEDQAFNQMYSGILSGDEAAKFLNKVFPKKGEIIQFPQKRSFKEEIEAMKKSGDLVDEKDMVISEKITNRDMFKEANEKFNKTDVIADTIARITSMEPVAAMKEVNKVIGRKGIYKNLDETQSKKILTDTEDWIFQRDPSDRYDYRKNRPFRDDPDFDPDDPDYIQRMKDEDAPDDFAQGGIAKFYTGGMVDVKPNLSDIGHGSDALMARTRLVAPNSQATTSTGLNYLLAEDNDNIRVPFAGGGDPKRRAFLKLLATLGGGAAAFKTGILGLGEGTGKKAVTETVKKAAGSGEVPPYFFKLVDKIKTMGDETLASQDKAIAKKYKDYVMEEDFAGNITIIKKDMNNPYPEEVIMSYKVDDVSLPSGKGMAKVDEYEEFTVRPDAEGKMKDIEAGVPDEVVNEGSVFEDNITEFGMTKKADGGRIGFQEGGGIESRLEQLGGDVTSAEQLLQELNQRLELAGSSIPEGGGATAPAGSGIFAGRPVDTGGQIQQLPGTQVTPPQTLVAAQQPMLGQPDPYKNTMLGGLSQDGQRFDSAQSAFDALAEQTRKYREASPHTRDVVGTEHYQGEKGFENFTNYFNEINNPSYTAPQLQLALSNQNLQKALPGLFADGGIAKLLGE
jgi:hypothetical protein